MNRKDKLEGEEIQKGLEEFLEQELDLSLAQPADEEDLFRNHKTDALDLSLARPVPESRTRKEATEKTVQENRSRREPERKAQQANKPQRQAAGKGMRGSGRERNPDKTQDAGKGGRKDMSRKMKKQNKNAKSNKKAKNDKKQKNKAVKVLTVIAAIFVLCFIGLYLIVGSVYKKMNYAEVENYTREAMKEDGVINVLLIGNDSRLEGDDGRSDAMILISISDKTKTITMTSLLRDMYVDIPGHDGNRLNAAYSYGGAELLMQTIEQNFDIPVHRYALVNFQAFANLVDAVGGVDLELTNEEVQYVNGYLMEYNQLEGKDLATDFLDPSLSGEIHLNGPQALAYTRNRYIGTDFGRTERQRKVLSAVIAKLPGAVLTNAGELADGLFPNLTTNLKQGECYSLSLNAWKFLGYKMVQQCVPAEGTYSNASIRGMDVLEVDFDANKQFLKSTLYGE